MKKVSKSAKRSAARRTMRDEYDFSGGTRGKYAARFAEGTNVVLLDSDLAARFRTSAAVNKALREYLKARPARRTA